MTEYEKQEIDRIRYLLSEEMDSILDIKNKEERMDKGLVILRINKIFDNYDELTPILEQYYELKHYRDKWEKEK